MGEPGARIIGVIASTATRTASQSASWVRAPGPRRMALIVENACSIGVQSGEEGGKKRSWQ